MLRKGMHLYLLLIFLKLKCNFNGPVYTAVLVHIVTETKKQDKQRARPNDK